MAPLSLKLLGSRTLSTWLRFPIGIITAIFGTIMAIVDIEMQSAGDIRTLSTNLLLTSIFATPLFVSAVLMTEFKPWSTKKHYLIFHLAVIGLSALYYLLLPGVGVTGVTSDFTRAGILIALSFLTIVSLPYLADRENSPSLWNFTVALIKRFFFTGVFTAAIYLGAVTIYASLNYLFNINVPQNLYIESWTVDVGVIGVWFFLSGVPEKMHRLSSTDFPKLLRHFIQYILIPLLAIYLVILYTYGVKIIATQIWPTGGVVWLILGCALTGTATYFGLYPLMNKTDEQWSRKTGKAFFVLLLPLMALYFTSIALRISDYGWTESRYLVIVLGFYLTTLSLYFFLGKKRDLFIVPALLATLLLVSIFGPWSMYGVSRASQTARLESILVGHGALVNGKIVNEGVKKDLGTHEGSAWSIVTYLTNNYGNSVLNSWLSEEAKAKIKEREKDEPYSTMSLIQQLIGIDVTAGDGGYPRDDASFSFDVSNNAEGSLREIGGYDYEMFITSSGGKESELLGASGNQLWSFSAYGKTYSVGANTTSFRILDDKSAILTELKVSDLVSKIAATQKKQYDSVTPAGVMNTNIRAGDLKIRLELMSIAGTIENGIYTPSFYQGRVLIGR